jgi:hypothetical protein
MNLHTPPNRHEIETSQPRRRLARGWDGNLDSNAIQATQAAWQKARTAYEHIEGALAPIFPEIDFSIDA